MIKSITVFTSNQPRHLNLINEIAKICDRVFAVIETTTVHPGEVEDFYRKSEIMQKYFAKVIQSEKRFFGDVSFLPSNVSPLVIKMGDLNKVNLSILKRSLDSDLFVVFGSSYIKGDLIEILVNKKSINIHMGVSPYYRGSSCNFWAMKNKDYHLVGSTIHMLSKGLDSGEMLFHALPSFEPNPFDFTMKAVKAAHVGLIEFIKRDNLEELNKVKQDKSLEISYTKNSDFNDEVASDFMEEGISYEIFKNKVEERDFSKLLNPVLF